MRCGGASLASLPTRSRCSTRASVLGNEFELALMADIMGVQRGEFRHIRRTWRWRGGLVVRHESDIGRFAFSHGLVQEALYEDLSAGERAEWHRRSAEAIEREYAGVEGAHLLALAEHWYRATPAVAPDQGIAAACGQQPGRRPPRPRTGGAAAAGGHPTHRGDATQARAGGARALSARSTGRPVAHHKGVRLGGAGRRLRPDARALCDELDQIGRRAQTLWRLAIIHLYRRDFEQSSSVGHELIRMAGEPGGSGAASLGHLRSASPPTTRSVWVRLAPTSTLPSLLQVRSTTATRPGLLSETTAVIDQVFSAWNLVLLDRADEAEAAIAVALEAAIAGGQTYPLAYALTFAADVAMLRRDADAARRRADRGFAVATENNHQFLVPFMVGVRGWARAAGEGDVEGAVVDVEDAAAGSGSLRSSVLGARFPGNAGRRLPDGRCTGRRVARRRRGFGAVRGERRTLVRG